MQQPTPTPPPTPQTTQARQSDEILALLDGWLQEDEQDQRETLEVLQQASPITIERDPR